MSLRAPTRAFLLLALPGCAGGGGPPAFYGHPGGKATPPEALREVNARPPGYDRLGRVVAQCRSAGAVTALDGDWLGDVDCSEPLLLAEVRETAAAVGGELLVAPSCTRDPKAASPREVTWIECEAIVAGHARHGPGPSGALPPAPPPPEPYPAARDAWAVEVTFVPGATDAPALTPIQTDAVAERAVMPAGKVRVGDVVARCADGCERTSARYAVRAAAGRVGATDVVAVSCVEARPGWLCTGQAARPEADPAVVPGAH